jgi:N-acetyl-beta-hexosaminidase
MNYFHWHLTDDQGWRIEIKKYPSLHQLADGEMEPLLAATRAPATTIYIMVDSIHRNRSKK